jgi:HPt (histidine-containing phosphotransfer) domain-containing protein
MSSVIIPPLPHWANTVSNGAAVQRLLHQLPFELEDIRALIDSVSTSTVAERQTLLIQIEVHAHRLRTRAATLDLPHLTSAAAWLEGCAQYGAEEKQLRCALGDCSRSLAEGTLGLQRSSPAVLGNLS